VELESLERIEKQNITHHPSGASLEKGSKIIISHHNFEKTPDLKFLENILKKMQKYSPEVYKIAVTPENEKDVEIVFELNKYFLLTEGFSPLKNIFISM
jgi:3-dehydroquinate dehydratase-1